jgi:hypothetical protein
VCAYVYNLYAVYFLSVDAACFLFVCVCVFACVYYKLTVSVFMDVCVCVSLVCQFTSYNAATCMTELEDEDADEDVCVCVSATASNLNQDWHVHMHVRVAICDTELIHARSECTFRRLAYTGIIRSRYH